MPDQACIRYTDADGCDREFSWISNVSDITKLQTFVEAVAPFIGATCTKIGVTHYVYVTIPGGGAMSDVNQKLQVIFNKTDDGGTTGFMLPAPQPACFDKIGQKYRLKKTIGDQLADYYHALTGINVTFQSGWLVGPQPNAP